MNTFGLNIKNGMGIYRPSCPAVIPCRKGFLVAVLDIPHGFNDVFVLCIFSKRRQGLGVLPIIGADGVVEKRGKLRIGIAKPTAMRDSVCHIDEFLRRNLIKIMKNRIL